MAEQKQNDQLEHTYSSPVRIRDVALKTCQRRWTIGRSGERVSGMSVLVARHNDDDSLPTLLVLKVLSQKYNCMPSLTKSHHHHHHVVPLAWISLTLSRHFSLSFIASGRSSKLHPVSSHSCCMYVRAGRPTFARPYVGVHRSTSLMSSSLLLQQCQKWCTYFFTAPFFIFFGYRI